MARLPRFFLFFLVALLILIGGYLARNGDNGDRLSEYYQLEKPRRGGPFPAVMLVPGCSGFDGEFTKAHYDRVQDRLVKSGFVTLRVNYLAARSAANCYPDVPTGNVAGDILIAAEYLRRQPFIKKGALNLLGWSWGGASALQALEHNGKREPVQVDAVVVYYPVCNRVHGFKPDVPVLVLLGGLDAVAPMSECETLFGGLPKRGNITVRVYEGAHHGFDISDLPANKLLKGALSYNEAAASSAWSELTAFLRK